MEEEYFELRYKLKTAGFLCLAILMAGSMLLGSCSAAKPILDPKKPTPVTIWHYYNGVQKQLFDEMVTEFNETAGAEQGIVVEAYSQGNVYELTEKVMAAIDKKVGADLVPDVFAAYADTAYAIDQRGMAAEIGQYLTEEERETYLASYLDEGCFDESGFKLFPIAKSTEVFVLNKTDWERFAAATGATDESFRTWEGLAAVADQYYQWTDSLTETPDDGKAFFGRDAMANYPIVGSVQLGKELFQVDNGKVTYQVDRDIMKRIWDCYYVPYINGWYTADGRFRSDDAKTGALIALVGSTSGVAYFPTAVTNPDGSSYPIEAQAYPLPNFEGTDPYAVQQGAGMLIVKSTEAKEYAAAAFLKWFTQEERNMQFCIGSGYLPVTKGANSAEAIEAALTANQEGSALLHQVVRIGAATVRESHLYTNKAFSSGTAARDVVETSLQSRAEEDREQILRLMEGGTSRADAVAEFATEASFERWFTDFESALTALR